ncbi:hypothetical protein ALC57_01225, partial [Trachymyrmex cornetzi]
YRQRLQYEFHAHTTGCALSCILDNDLSAEQLQYISKVVLLRVYGDYIDYVSIDGPAPKIKDCSERQRRAAVC